MELPKSVLTKSQFKKFEKPIKYDGRPAKIIAEVRYDDQCGNGHNSFSITGEIWLIGNRRDCEICGCIHEEIEKYFPELKHLIKWHLCSSDGPMHYLANTLYLASDKDYKGRRKGEASSWDWFFRFGDFPLRKKACKVLREFVMASPNTAAFWAGLNIEAIEHKRDDYAFKPHYKFTGMNNVTEWHFCPFGTLAEAEDFIKAAVWADGKIYIDNVVTAFSEGKEPELEAAKHSAIWPDATLEQLQDKQALIDRLPGLLKAFKEDVEALGFTY